MRTNRIHTAGFSLIEMLIYISVLVIFSAGALTMLFSLSDRFAENRTDQLLAQTSRSILERMLIDIRQADLVDTFYSVFDSSPGALTLVSGSTTIDYTLSSSTIFLSEDGQEIGPLNDHTVSVDSLLFYHYDNSVTEMVRIELTLTAFVGEASSTRTFYAGTTLRGSYE